VSRLAAASESASASGGSGLAAMGADSRSERCFLGRHCRRLRRGCQIPRRRISEMAAGDSRNKALEWQPCFLRPKELRHGTESRRHRAWRQLLRRWRPGDSGNIAACDGPASSLRMSFASEGSRPARSRDAGFRRWQPATQGIRLWKAARFLPPKKLRHGRESPCATGSGG
jgi:hypothetical protein